MLPLGIACKPALPSLNRICFNSQFSILLYLIFSVTSVKAASSIWTIQKRMTILFS